MHSNSTYKSKNCVPYTTSEVMSLTTRPHNPLVNMSCTSGHTEFICTLGLEVYIQDSHGVFSLWCSNLAKATTSIVMYDVHIGCCNAVFICVDWHSLWLFSSLVLLCELGSGHHFTQACVLVQQRGPHRVDIQQPTVTCNTALYISMALQYHETVLVQL